MRRHEPQRARDGDLERVAVPVRVGKEYLGTVRFSVARAGYDRSLQVVGRSTLLVGLVFVLVGVGLSAVLARRLVKPLERLSGMADRAARGDLDQTIELETNDEIADLARSFNTMLGAVRASLAEVHQVAYTDKLTGLPEPGLVPVAPRARPGRLRPRPQDCSPVSRSRPVQAAQRFPRPSRRRPAPRRGRRADRGMRARAGRRGHPTQRLSARRGRVHRRASGPGHAGRGRPPRQPDRRCPRRALRLSAPRTYVASTSIGIALHPDDAASPEELLRNADIAMYQAKQAGRNSWRFYDAHMADLSLRRDALERELRLAIDENQFEVHFQPQISVATGEVVGAEALVRWRHPREGLVFPDRFLLIAQEAGLMPAHHPLRDPLGAADGQGVGLLPRAAARLAVNVSAADLETEDRGMGPRRDAPNGLRPGAAGARADRERLDARLRRGARGDPRTARGRHPVRRRRLRHRLLEHRPTQATGRSRR